MKITGITIVKDNIVVELDTKIPDSVDSDFYLYIDTPVSYTHLDVYKRQTIFRLYKPS